MLSLMYFLQIANVLWWYFFSKAVELIDTVLMILRKKTRQVSFLHVFHHATMLNIWWWVMMFIPGGICKLIPLSTQQIFTRNLPFTGTLLYMLALIQGVWSCGSHMIQVLQWFLCVLNMSSMRHHFISDIMRKHENI